MFWDRIIAESCGGIPIDAVIELRWKIYVSDKYLKELHLYLNGTWAKKSFIIGGIFYFKLSEVFQKALHTHTLNLYVFQIVNLYA